MSPRAIPDLERTQELLRRARNDLEVRTQLRGRTVVLPLGELASVPKHPNLSLEFARDGDWPADAPVLRELEEWIDDHWSECRDTAPPAGTISLPIFPVQHEPRLDTATAAKKLAVAAALHGADSASAHASEFSQHGMVEQKAIYFLTGLSIHKPRQLDDYCTLMPSSEALSLAESCFSYSPLRGKLPASLANVCALVGRCYVIPATGHTFLSPLLREGPDAFALLLGLVQGVGLRRIADWRDFPLQVTDVLPFRLLSGGGGSHEWQSSSRLRPLCSRELSLLAKGLHQCRREDRPRLNVALNRLRRAHEKQDREDRVVDLGIALEALFTERKERGKTQKISNRGAWYFSDSDDERRDVRTDLESFYRNLRSEVVHGNPIALSNASMRISDRALEVARAGLKEMIVNGRPNWREEDCTRARHDPRREETEVLSDKADTLSWKIAEMKTIDEALEAAWRATLEGVPNGRPSEVHVYQGSCQDSLDRLREDGAQCVLMHPSVLYSAHPKWPRKEDAGEPTERTKFYCERDVRRHLVLWEEAAVEKGGGERLHLFKIGSPDAGMYYHPKNRSYWPT